MTIAVSIKINDGIILASDSASSLIQTDDKGNFSVIKIFENADKIFNLYKGYTIGAMTWGSGGIGSESQSTIFKDFRKIIMENSDQKIDPKKYKIKDIAKKFKKFISEKYYNEYNNVEKFPVIGYLITGYSSGEILAEEYLIEFNEDGKCEGPKTIRECNESGAVAWWGEPEAIFRLIKGYSMALPKVLTNLGVNSENQKIILEECKNLELPFVYDAMPVQDAIDLGIYLVNLTINFSKFKPGAETVGGPIEVAAITKHEGFKWVRRKHYFSKEFNPEVETK